MERNPKAPEAKKYAEPSQPKPRTQAPKDPTQGKAGQEDNEMVLAKLPMTREPRR
jgi:hypothetical protein